jgi:hypothetical protein
VHGTTDGNGGCTFTPPKLTLAPSERAIQADQISLNTANCTAVWQIGTPTDLANASPPDLSTLRAVGAVGESSPGVALTSSSGDMQGWLEDVVGLTLTRDRTYLSWDWDGSCTYSVGGSAAHYWSSESGWETPWGTGVWTSQDCTLATAWSQGTFRNQGFCWPSTVMSYYSGVTARGCWDGTLGGSIDSAYNTGSCLPLWQHQQLVRTT